MSDSVMVAVRCRPFNKREVQLGAKLIVQMQGPRTTLSDPSGGVPPRDFTFDYSYWSFDPAAPNFATNPKVYADLGVNVLNNAWQGFNCCLLAYGQTGSGKSYSMVGYGEDKGIVPQAMEEMFKRIQNNKDPNIKFVVEASMMEIYNERVKDLFNPDNEKSHPNGLKVRDHPQTGPYVEDLSRALIKSYDEFQNLLTEGNAVRTVAATQMNATSSRAHTVFQIVLTMTTYDEETKKSSSKTSKINLVDLAGSERLSKTGASGQQMKEGIGINKSLTALGNCIEKLAKKANIKKGGKEVHVPYRDSVLTWLLKESLGGNAKTIMIAAISPADDNYEETLSTLRYADRAKQIKNKAIVNEDENARVIRELKKEIQALRDALARGGTAGSPAAGDKGMSGMTDKEREEYLALKERMKANEELMAKMNMSWEEKVRQSEELAFKRAAALHASSDIIEKKKKMPHMVNLHKDRLMSECLSYFFPPGTIRLCTKQADPPPGEDDIVLSGLQIKPLHAQAEHDPKTHQVFLTPEEGARVFVNGALIKGRTELNHNDRVICGAHLVFRVIMPNHATDDSESAFDWEYANKELTNSTIEALNKPDEETLKAQQEAEAKMKAMQEEIERERAKAREEQERKQQEYEAHLAEIARKKEEEIEATRKALEATKHAEAEKQLQRKLAEREAELERERAAAAKLHSERLEKMKAEQAALEAKLAAQQKETAALHKKHETEKRDRALLEENLMHVIPLVNEANAICTELGQSLRYSIKLEAKRSLDDDAFTERTDVWIRVVNLDDEMEVLWDMDTLTEALYVMRELYNNFLRTGKINIPSSKSENPFHLEPTGPMLIGSSRLYLQPCYFLLPIHESTAIIDYKGEHKGQLYVNLIPVPPRDEETEGLPEDELFFDEEELSELKGEPLTMRLEIKKCMGLPSKLCKNVFVSYRFFYDDKEVKTIPASRVTINPMIDYERQLLIDIVEEEFVEYIKSGILEFQIFGEQNVQDDEEEDDDDEKEEKKQDADDDDEAERTSSNDKNKKKDKNAKDDPPDNATSQRIAKLEAVLRDITSAVQLDIAGGPSGSASQTDHILRERPEMISAKVKDLARENVALKSPEAKAQARAEAEAEANQLRQQLEQLRQGKADPSLIEENNKLKNELESLKKNGSSGGPATKSMDELEASNVALRAELAALRNGSSGNATLESENAALKASLASMQRKAAHSAASASRSNMDEDAAAALAAVEAEREELKAKLQAAEKEAQLLQSRLAASSSSTSDAFPDGRELSQLRRELESARRKIPAHAGHGHGGSGSAAGTSSTDAANDPALLSAVAAKDRELEELRRQLQENQKKSKACVIL